MKRTRKRRKRIRKNAKKRETETALVDPRELPM